MVNQPANPAPGLTRGPDAKGLAPIGEVPAQGRDGTDYAPGSTRGPDTPGGPANQERPALDTVWQWLDQVPDPEIPVISVVDLGIVRDVAWDGDTLVVTITPTYSGCPATSVINMDVEAALRARGIENLSLKRQIAPPWTTDWLSDKGRARLTEYGIAPPNPAGGPDACPHCGAGDVERISQFGSTPCKAQWRCRACLEPFDYFKCI